MVGKQKQTVLKKISNSYLVYRSWWRSNPLP
ncbi:MAG: hypothetical protein MRERV_7c059 [Mycoplasmataceae bacterium RV_VA103A]|nr:MAG: hypothetical protein MRERV_7c059 [Mycoplasmataceae bacterium RV_VA103A]